MAKVHTTLDLDRDLLRDAAEALGTTRTTDTVRGPLHHRQVRIPDLVIAAVAVRNVLALVHDDRDDDIGASSTGQPTRWAAPRGAIR
jgi:predicted nucleic acid-binding protein